MHQVSTFREASVREAILNAIAHRDYRHPGSVFLRQYARRLDIVSPGGFPLGITPDNIIDKQYPRNRRIAETFLRCGLVERSGQGANRMLEECVRDSKPLPDYSRSDSHGVALTLHGDVQDPSFIRYLKALEAERTTPFSSHEYLVLDMVRRGVPIPKDDRAVLQSLKSDGAIESQGRGRGTRYVLTRRIDDQAGGAHPLDRQALKELLRDYLRSRGADGSSLSELLLEFRPLTRDRAQSLLRELRASRFSSLATRPHELARKLIRINRLRPADCPYDCP